MMVMGRPIPKNSNWLIELFDGLLDAVSRRHTYRISQPFTDAERSYYLSLPDNKKFNYLLSRGKIVTKEEYEAYAKSQAEGSN